jgi:antitoxin component YwqK of YwqJK toxin-antitoxin module
VVQERYPDGKPKLVVTFVLLDSNRVKRAEERFNRDGERDGLQKEYYESGQVKTEARYYYGKLEWYREFQPDGVKKIGKSDFDWFWLKK